MKDELGGKIMKKVVGLRAKTCKDTKKSKEAKNCIITRKRKFEDYKNCLEVTQLENKINYLERKELDKIVLKKFIKNS